MKKFLFVFVVVLVGLIYGALQLEFVQKKLFDTKADYLGTDRTVTFYAKMTGDKVASFTDQDTRINFEKQGEISIWLGKQKKKVVSNMDYIVEDSARVSK